MASQPFLADTITGAMPPVVEDRIKALTAPVFRQASRSTGDIYVTWSSLAPLMADGSLDLVIPAKVGDLIIANRNVQCDNSTLDFEFNLATTDATGATLRQLGGGGTGGTIGAWTVRGGNYFGSSGEFAFIVQAGDLVSGSVRLRLLVYVGNGSAAGRTLFAKTQVPFLWYATNYSNPGASGTALSLDSTADSTTRLAMTPAERTKVAATAPIVSLTQAAYDALATKDAATLYLITG